ncbi:MAG: peptidoglycan-binding protein [Parvibaculaceae bacterium]
MKPGIPWSVKGIDQEAREAAKDAARRSGMTLGEWLNTLIKEQADEAEPVQAPRAPQPGRESRLSDDIASRLDRLADQLTSLTREGNDTAASRFAPHAVHAAVETHSIATLVDRVERNEREAAALIADLVDRFGRLEETSAELARRPVAEMPQRPEDVPGYTALEGALRNIVAHIETSDTRIRDTLKSVQDRLSNLAARTDQADRAQSQHASQSAALEYLEDRVSELAQQLAEGGKSVRRDVEAQIQAQVGSEIAKLSQRIDTVRASQEGLGQKIEAAALDAVQRETRGIGARVGGEVTSLADQVKALKLAQDSLGQKLQASSLQAAQREARDVERRLQASIAELQNDDGAAQETARDLKRTMAAIESLEQRFDDIKMEAASEREVKALKLSMEQISATVAQFGDTRPLETMERRLSDLGRRLDNPTVPAQLASHLEDLERRVFDLGRRLDSPAVPAQLTSHLEDLERRLSDVGRRLDNPAVPAQLTGHLDDLETRIHHLDARLKEAMVAASDSVSLQTFEAEIQQTGERISSVEQRMDHLATLERSVTQLYASLDENRTATRGIAEDAARATAERLIARDRGPSTELRALEAGLEAVRASAATADKRTQETLEAVHETLEQIVAQLAAVEGREAAPTVYEAPAVYQAPAPQPQAFAARLREPEPTTFEPPAIEPPAYEAPRWSDIEDRAPMREAEPQAEEEPGEFDPGPLPEIPAPASEPARRDRFEEPSGRDSFEEPEREEHEPPAVREDFIAAARRAAQTAARPQSPLLSTLGSFATRRSTPEAEGPQQEAKTSRFRIPFLRPRKAPDAEEAEAAEDPEPAPEKSGTRKRLILAGLALLVAVAAYTANRTLNSGQSGRAPTAESTSRLEAPARRDAALDTPPEAIAMAEADISALERAASDNFATASLAPNPSTLDSRASDRLDESDGLSPKSNFEQRSAPLPESSLGQAALPPVEAGPQSLRQAALAGDPNAAFIVATRYLDGQGVAQDLPRAVEWFGRAAEKGLAPAQYRLATLYERGRGVAQSREAATAWYLKAASNGNVKSMHNLAVLYADSADGEPHYDQAAHWFGEAAKRGLKDSQFNFAVLSERGLGVPRSTEEAYVWYSLAGKQGDTDAAGKAKAIEATLKPAQLDDLKQRISAWAPETVNREANYVAAIDPSWQAASEQPAPQAQVVNPGAQQLFGKALIKRAQELLAGRGFDIGTPDGVMGSRTTNAVRLFQERNGLSINGMVTNDLVQSLEGSRI